MGSKFHVFQQCKNFQNWLRFDEVIVKVWQHPFLRHRHSVHLQNAIGHITGKV